MKLLERVTQLVRAAANDLFSEEPYQPANRTQTVLADSQARLVHLRQELAQAVAREKRGQAAYKQSAAAAAEINQRIHTLMNNGNPDAAARLLPTLNQQQQQADAAQNRYQTYQQASNILRIEIDHLLKQIQHTQNLSGSLAEQEENIVMLEQLNQTKQDHKQEMNDLRQRLADHGEHLARREDSLSARQDLEDKSLPDT